MNWIIIGIIVFMSLIELGLDGLNYRHRKRPIPENVKDILDPKEYQKSLDYNMENTRFGVVGTMTKTLVIIALLSLGFFAWLETFAQRFTEIVLIQTLIFLFVYYVINRVLYLPFSYYLNFVIEEKFGFNKMTKKLFVIDFLKSFFWTVLIGGALISASVLIYQLFIDFIPLFIGFVFILITLFMIGAFVFQGWFVRKFNDLTPLEEGSLRTRINELATQLGFSVERIFVMDGSKRSKHANAYFTGLGKKREIVLFDTLIDQLSEDEVVSVMAHELGHATHKDAIKLLSRNLIQLAVYALSIGLLLTQEIFFTSFGLSGIQFGFALILLSLMIQPIDLLFGIYINAFSRRIEYKADAFAAKYTSKEVMIGALKKFVKESFENMTPHPLYVFVYYNHPTVSERIASLSNPSS